MTQKDCKNNTELPFWLKVLTTLSIVIAFIAFGMYILHFGNEISNKQETWGQFGDYIGGILNPLFAFTGLLALLYTIVLQSRELRSSSEQLKKSAEALQSQNSVLERQNFEATFFQLLRLYNDILEELHITTEESEALGALTKKVKHVDRQCIEALHQILLNEYLHKVNRGDFADHSTIEAIDKVYKEFYSKYAI